MRRRREKIFHGVPNEKRPYGGKIIAHEGRRRTVAVERRCRGRLARSPAAKPGKLMRTKT
jgi:hypothetical protein